MLTLAETILGAVTQLFGVKTELARAKVERRGRIADLFARMAECLEGTAASIRAGDFPAGRCAELLAYAQELPSAIDDELGDERAGTIAGALRGAHEVERLHSDRNTPAGRADLERLESAAGMLRAMGNLVRV